VSPRATPFGYSITRWTMDFKKLIVVTAALIAYTILAAIVAFIPLALAYLLTVGAHW